jgi:hypothetical protein
VTARRTITLTLPELRLAITALETAIDDWTADAAAFDDGEMEHALAHKRITMTRELLAMFRTMEKITR